MQIAYKTAKLEKQAESLKSLTKALGPVCAKKFAQRVSEFAAAECLEDLRNLPGPRIHELTPEIGRGNSPPISSIRSASFSSPLTIRNPGRKTVAGIGAESPLSKS